MRYEFIQLAEHILNASKGKKVYLFVSPGNWGDALIRYGTICFLKYFRIPFEELYINDNVSDKLKWVKAGFSNSVLLVMGGGAWAPHYTYLAPTVKKIQGKYNFKHIVVMPSTYADKYQIDNCTFFRRDKAESASNMPGTPFCHDLAFFIGDLQIQAGTEHKVAHCFRKDGESSKQHTMLESNFDLSGEGTHLSDVFGFFDYIAGHSVIHTDRLHIAIGSCLLGKEVHMYPGRYFKNRAIFDASITGYFENVHLHDVFTGE
jgi:exopolysaccharide biosynthesis predicted pyruvyltransferase EpsI